MHTDDKDFWISLKSGGRFHYIDDSEDHTIQIEDVANALANLCRFCGHVPKFYSVAQHSVNVSWLVPPCRAMEGLMHDAAEAFISDIPSPLKWAVPALGDIEKTVHRRLAARFEFNPEIDFVVKEADRKMLLLEKLAIKHDTSEWPGFPDEDLEHCLSFVELKPWSPDKAKRKFLQRFEQLNSPTLCFDC